MNHKQQQLANIPSVNRMLQAMKKQHPEIIPDTVLKESIKLILGQTRQTMNDTPSAVRPSDEELVGEVVKEYRKRQEYSLKKVINATGTIVHTNLGRSILSEHVKQQLMDTSFSYSNLEYNLERGERGSRYDHLESIIQELTGAEAVVVVNNNAAAVMLALSTIVPNKEVVISRGELVEIGGSFRIPDVIELSGGTICEVGTTNKTHLVDYENSITENTGALMKVHTSNYRIVGFTESVSIESLSELAHKNGVPLINDLGSGLLIDLQRFGLPYEPTIKEAITKGCDVVMFSGDKLLGGPQVGVIVGKKEYIEPMKKSQLLRALRVDKMTLSVLEATLKLYLDEEQAIAHVPTLNMISQTYQECQKRAMYLEELLLAEEMKIKVTRYKEESNIGGGSYPEYTLPTEIISITSEWLSVSELENKLRLVKYPVIGRVKKDQFLLDVRTIQDKELPIVIEMIKEVVGND